MYCCTLVASTVVTVIKILMFLYISSTLCINISQGPFQQWPPPPWMLGDLVSGMREEIAEKG